MPCTGLCGCANCKNRDIQEQVAINAIFDDDVDFGKCQDGHTDGEAADSSDSSKDELFDDDEIDNDSLKTESATEVDCAIGIDLPCGASSALNT